MQVVICISAGITVVLLLETQLAMAPVKSAVLPTSKRSHKAALCMYAPDMFRQIS